MTLIKKRIVWIIIGTLAIVFTTWLELFVQKKHYLIGGGLNRSFLFLLINVHVVIVVALLYLIIRHVIKIFLERHKGRPGSVFKSNLVFAFILFSVIPSFFVFFTAGKFITRSIDRWFQARLDGAFVSAQQLHQYHTRALRDALEQRGGALTASFHNWELDQYPYETVLNGQRCSTYLLDASYHGIGDSLHDEVVLWRSLRKVNDRTTASLMAQFLAKLRLVEPLGGCFDFYGSLYWAKRMGNRVCLIAYRYPDFLRDHLVNVDNAYMDYDHLYSMRDTIYHSYFFTFLVIALLILFLSLWAAFYLARGISTPIQELLEATEHIRQGRWDVQVPVNPSSDLHSLARGFNQMTAAVRLAHASLDRKNKEMLTMLENLSSAVFVTNKFGRIIFCNHAAQRLVAAYRQGIQCEGKKASIFGVPLKATLFALVRELVVSKREHIIKEISCEFASELRTFMVYGRLLSLSPSFDASSQSLLVVIDDVTDMVKVNKIKTWQEAAKQMAHEIKNPLTPIQLATQHLQRRFRSELGTDPIFLKCTTTILQQVGIIQDLVTHFSCFASMPAPFIEMVNVDELVRDVLCLYQLGYSEISFVYQSTPKPLVLKTDRNRLRLVLINLLDNSVRALIRDTANTAKMVSIVVSLDDSKQRAIIRFADNGPGIASSVKETLFMPYVSTEKKNMGLGLAIVHDSIAQLGGTVILERAVLGASFCIELPL